MSEDKFKSAGRIPYGFLIDIYQKYNATPDQMLEEVKTAYPGVYIGRTDRFCNTVRRIVAPTIPSILNGKVTLSGDSLLRYRNKIWMPKIRNTSMHYNAVHKFIIIEILPKCSVSSCDDSTSDVDCTVPGFALEDVITADSNSDTRSTIPSFVDHHYAPRNVKRREQGKNRKIALLRKEMKSLKNKLANSERVISRLQQDCRTIKEQKERSLNRLKKQYNLSILDFMKLDAERNDLLPSPPSPPPPINLETKEGKRYSPIIRTLYYSLLASQVPPGKISKIIRDVLVAFFPDVDASKVKLPAGTCANYMRREELKTICLAQQATGFVCFQGATLKL